MFLFYKVIITNTYSLLHLKSLLKYIMNDCYHAHKKYHEYIKPWTKYRKSNRKNKRLIIPSLIYISL